MCGGRGTRLGGETEKPRTPIADRPMVDRVLDALAESRIETTYAIVSPHAPRTREHLRRRGEQGRVDLSVVDAPGDGYVSDLQHAVETVEEIERPVLTVAADLPLLNGEAIDAVLGGADTEARSAGSLTVCVPAERKRELGVSADTATEVDGREVVPAGINVVGDAEDENEDDDNTVHLTDDGRFAINVNYPSDVRIAENLLADGVDDETDYPDTNS